MQPTRAPFPILLAAFLGSAAPGAAAPRAKPAKAAADAGTTGAPPQEVKLRVTDAGFEPATATVRAHTPVKLSVTRVSDETCATELLLPEANVRLELPLNTTVETTFTPKKAGRLVYGCAMGMMVSGVLLVEER